MGFIIFGLVLVIIGGILVIKTKKVFDFFGALPLAERFLSVEGGSILAYKLIGLFFIFLGFLMVFNLFEGFMRWILPAVLFGG